MMNKIQPILLLSWYSMYSVLHHSQPHPESDRVLALGKLGFIQFAGYKLTSQTGNPLFQVLSILYLLYANLIVFFRPVYILRSYSTVKQPGFFGSIFYCISSWWAVKGRLLTDPITFH